MSRDLRLAVDYLFELDGALSTKAISDDPRVRSAARNDMRFQLDRVREIVSQLEHTDPDAQCQHTVDRQEVEVDLVDVRIWCHTIEARIMAVCYDDYPSAVGWMQRAVAIDPTRAHNHALLALIMSGAHQHEQALAAIERAISLEPENIEHRKTRDDLIRSAIPAPDPTPDYPWWHAGRYLR